MWLDAHRSLAPNLFFCLFDWTGGCALSCHALALLNEHTPNSPRLTLLNEHTTNSPRLALLNGNTPNSLCLALLNGHTPNSPCLTLLNGHTPNSPRLTLLNRHTPNSLSLVLLNGHMHLTHRVYKAAHVCTRTHFRYIFTRGLCLVLVHVYMCQYICFMYCLSFWAM